MLDQLQLQLQPPGLLEIDNISGGCGDDRKSNVDVSGGWKANSGGKTLLREPTRQQSEKDLPELFRGQLSDGEVINKKEERGEQEKSFWLWFQREKVLLFCERGYVSFYSATWMV